MKEGFVEDCRTRGWRLRQETVEVKEAAAGTVEIGKEVVVACGKRQLR